MATLKPPSPLRALEQQPLKPTTPMQPKNAPKIPISHPQRRCRFQLRLGRRPQRRCRFQIRLGRRPQRRQGFHTSRPPGRQGLAGDAHGQQRHHRPPNFARNLSWSFFETPQKRCNSNDANSMFEQVAGELRAKLMGGGGTWPGDQWAANVTNVVKPTRFKSPREDPCDKRRQSKPKNHHFQRKSPRIDDVCNNNAESHTKNSSD